MLILLATITGCNTKIPVSSNGDQSLSNQNQSTAPKTETINETSLAEVTNILPNPPLEYDPAWPDRTVKSSIGHLVNSCVPDELRDKATTLTTSDEVYLSALVLGSGNKGVLACARARLFHLLFS